MSAPATPRAGSPQLQAASESTRTEAQVRLSRDWAAKTAADILQFIFDFTLDDEAATAFVAAHLRLAHGNGVVEGLRRADETVKRVNQLVSRYSENGAGE